MNDNTEHADEPRQSPIGPGETAADVLGPAAALAGEDVTTGP